MKRYLIVFLALLSLLCAACSPVEPVEEEGEYLIYFPADTEQAKGSDAIAGIHMDLAIGDDPTLTEEAMAVVMALMRGTEEMPHPFGEHIYLRNLTITGRRAYVDISPSYAELTGIEMSMADYCIALTLTELEGISAVSITAGGKELFYRSNAVLMERDVLLSDMEDVIETVEVMLYFLDEEGELAPERRVLELYEGQTLAESLISALLSGPVNRELTALIPEDFVVNGIRVEEGICYLSLPAKTLETLPESVKGQEQLVRALANSIYSMETVDEICILADGEELEHIGVVDLDLIRFRPREERK